MHVRRVCARHSACVVRGQLVGLSSHLLLCGSCGLDLVLRPDGDVSLPTEPCHRLTSRLTINSSDICGVPALHHIMF